MRTAAALAIVALAWLARGLISLIRCIAGLVRIPRRWNIATAAFAIAIFAFTAAGLHAVNQSKAVNATVRPRPEYVACSIARHYYTNPDSASAVGCTGSGLWRLRISCYYFDGGPYTVTVSNWYLTLFVTHVTLQCTSARPFLYRASIEHA